MSEELDQLIKTALAKDESKLNLNNKSFNRIMDNFKADQRRLPMKTQIFFRPKVVKVAAATFAIALVCGFSITYIQPVQAIAAQAKSFIYTIVKTSNGTYSAVKVPEPKDNHKGLISVSSKDGGKVPLGFPEKLEGGYSYSNSSQGKDLDTNAAMNSIFYEKGNITLVLSYSNSDSAFVTDPQGHPYKADNAQNVLIGTQQAVYGEYPYGQFPIISDGQGGGSEDRTQPPVIKVIHTLSWVNGGTYYKLDDMGGNVSMKDLVKAASSFIH